MKFGVSLLLLFLSGTSFSQPMTHVEACRKFSDEVVQVNTDRVSGTGFIAGADGWIITALHVVADPDTLAVYENPRSDYRWTSKTDSR
jgi:S1-C subfamily serine protease